MHLDACPWGGATGLSTARRRRSGYESDDAAPGVVESRAGLRRARLPLDRRHATSQAEDPSARIRRGRMFVRWRRGLERGSGVATHEVFVDGRRAGRVPAVRTVANLLVSTDDSVAIRVGRGRHRLRIVAVDRAGNRSRSAGRIVRP